MPQPTADPEAPIVVFRDVSFAYGNVSVLEDVNLTIGPRESVSIVGPNGGGKTTLLKLILGLLQPTSGEIRIFGRTPEAARARVGYMPQYLRYDPRFPVTAMDVVLMGRLGGGGVAGFFGWHGRGNRQAALQSLAEVNMQQHARRPFSNLSGGQQQRVLIARALCVRPELLLLDEPTANVDARIEAQLLEILEDLNRRMSIVMVSHDLGFVIDMVHSVICVNCRVVVHPTSELTGEVIRDIYGGDVRMVRHDHRCSVEGHEHD